MKSLIAICLVFAVSSVAAKVQPWMRPPKSWQPVRVTECPDSAYSAPLGRTVPTLQDFEIDVRDSWFGGVAKVNFKIDDSQKRGDEPDNVFVLNADHTLDIKSVYVYRVVNGVQQGRVDVDRGSPPASICRDTSKNLLIVTMDNDEVNCQQVGVAVRYAAPIREGSSLQAKGRRREASFEQASKLVPCIEDQKSRLRLTVKTGYLGYKVSSPVAELEEVRDGGLFKFRPIKDALVSHLSFEIVSRYDKE